MSDIRIAVVTGAASGIGAAIAARLVNDGLSVTAIDIASHGPPEPPEGAMTTVRADVASPDDVQRAISGILDAAGRIDVLVNNAGISGSPAATICHETPIDEWDRIFAVNARGPFLCTRAVLPAMLRQASGHVINIASVAGLIAFPGRCAYTAAKGAVVQFTKSLAVDYARQGVRANAVCPGFVQTPMTQWRLDRPDLRAAVEARIPMGRVAQPDEIADAVSLLASDRLRYLTGHMLTVDGGWTAL
jgi:NAD(P)-dependent dehydrogenase (short-subunit alcohol dehydrogenase family)